jgi:putative copper export protein/mono/diheme cytochrome c family protein
VSSLRLLARGGRALKEAPLRLNADRTVAEFPLDRLEAGAYTAAWKVLSAVDGHVTRGVFAFAYVPPGMEGSVGALGAPEALSPGQRAWIGTLRALRVAAVWAHLVALLAVTGACIVWWAVLRHAGPGDPGPGGGLPVPPALARLVLRGSLVAIVGGVLALQLEWLQVAEGPWAQTFQLLIFFPAIPVALGTWSSIATFIRLALLTGVASLATRFAERDPIALPGVLVLGAASVASIAVASHTAATGGLWWAVPDLLHLSAVAVWVGGLVLLALLAIRPAGDGAPTLPGVTLRDAMRRFTPWAAASVALLALTGVLSGALHVPRWAALWRTLYGAALTAKGILFVALLGLALLNTRWCRGRLGPGSLLAPVWAWGERRFGRADWAVRAELALAGAALFCAASLTQIPPPKEVLAEPPPPITLNGRADGYTLAITITSPQGLMGPNRVAVSLLDAQGRPPAPDARVILRPEMVEHEMRIAPITATPRAGATGGGWYDADVFFSMLGRWDLDVVMRRKGTEDATLRLALRLDDAGFAPLDPAERPGTRLSLAAAWNGASTRRQLLIGAGLALGAGVLAALGAWHRRWVELVVAGGLLAVGGFSLWFAAAVDTTPATVRRNPIPSSPASAAAGGALFGENCAQCHGAAGRPSPFELAPTLSPYAVNLDLRGDHMAQHTDGDLFWWITRGVPKTPMPAFGPSLSEEERWHLVNYVRALRHDAEAAR